ncbi:hypothetical protein [Komagataeibacter intermedius]|nr:hypothetical protein [Komagataeibacter intermedius]
MFQYKATAVIRQKVSQAGRNCMHDYANGFLGSMPRMAVQIAHQQMPAKNIFSYDNNKNFLNKNNFVKNIYGENYQKPEIDIKSKEPMIDIDKIEKYFDYFSESVIMKNIPSYTKYDHADDMVADHIADFSSFSISDTFEDQSGEALYNAIRSIPKINIDPQIKEHLQAQIALRFSLSFLDNE